MTFTGNGSRTETDQLFYVYLLSTLDPCPEKGV